METPGEKIFTSQEKINKITGRMVKNQFFLTIFFFFKKIENKYER